VKKRINGVEGRLTYLTVEGTKINTNDGHEGISRMGDED
jgi:hypothetical protein